MTTILCFLTQQHFEPRLFWKNAEKLRKHASLPSHVSNEIISNQICREFLKMLKSSRFYQILQYLTRFYHRALDFLSNLHKQTLGVTRKAFWQLIRSKIDKSMNVTRDYSTHASLVFTLDFNRAKQKSIDWNLHTYRPQKSLLHTYVPRFQWKKFANFPKECRW